MMNRKGYRKPVIIILALTMAAALLVAIPAAGAAGNKNGGTTTVSGSGAGASVTAGTPVYSADDLFSKRDLEQAPDLSGAETLTLASGQDVTVTEAGVYVLSGTVTGTTVIVEAPDDAKVQLVLDGVSITNADFPCIYVKSADKVFITVAADSSLSVTGAFRKDGSTNTDGVIFSREDLTLNGTAALTISSTDNGIVGKDDLKVTGGTYVITAASKCIEANDSIRIAGGSFTLQAGTDGLHAENNDDASLGYVYIADGDFAITAGDDGIHASSVVQIDGGSFVISASEGIEATYVQINGGTLDISARDDGINAAYKSDFSTPAVEINGGDITITMAQGDTDGIDANGNIVINGGTVISNGQQVSVLPNQRFGGPGGGWGGPGGWGGQGGNPGGWGGPGGQGGWGGRGR